MVLNHAINFDRWQHPAMRRKVSCGVAGTNCNFIYCFFMNTLIVNIKKSRSRFPEVSKISVDRRWSVEKKIKNKKICCSRHSKHSRLWNWNVVVCKSDHFA